MHMDYILFDDCYMSSVEVAHALRHVTDYLIGSTSEIMAYGFPYALAGKHMLGAVDTRDLRRLPQLLQQLRIPLRDDRRNLLCRAGRSG